jgi:prefoldin subunit 5
LSSQANEVQNLNEENGKLKQRIQELETEIGTLERARDSFKGQFLELREINKDLRT